MTMETIDPSTPWRFRFYTVAAVADLAADDVAVAAGGCTIYHGVGFWRDRDGIHGPEDAAVIDVVTAGAHYPAVFRAVIDAARAYGEDAVLVVADPTMAVMADTRSTAIASPTRVAP